VYPRASLDDVEKRKFLTLQGLELLPLDDVERRKILAFRESNSDPLAVQPVARDRGRRVAYAETRLQSTNHGPLGESPS
jgi:hypothetical protein